VIIQHNGVKEKLLLKSGSEALFQSQQKSAAQSVAAQQTVKSAGSDRYLDGSQSAQLNAIGKELKSAPMSIAKYIRFQPLNKKGQWVGVQIWPKGDDSTLFKALGFQTGDVLKQVNGKNIDQMAKNPKLWQSFLAGNNFDLVVERNGSEVPINVQFDE